MDSYLILWDVGKREIIKKIKLQNFCRNICFTNDLNFLIAACWDKKVVVYSLENDKVVQELIGHTDSVCSLDISRDNK